jgi:hypothetical protein
MAKKKSEEKPKGASLEKQAPHSLDEAIGKGLTPQKSSSYDEDYSKHPKFSKFNLPQGVK